MQKHFNIFIRNSDAGLYLEYFLISAVASILFIRLFLALTGYPQIGGDTLHIAHMLWGGLLMLVSIYFLLAFLGRRIERIGAVIGGIGFGTFIDEVGKFITQDNNYFYQPVIALIYVFFILIVMGVRTVHVGKKFREQEFLMNALRELEEIARNDLDIHERNKAYYLLERSNRTDQFTRYLKMALDESALVAPRSPGVYTRFKDTAQKYYQKIVDLPVFSVFIIFFFIFQLVINISYIVIFIFFWGLGWEQITNLTFFQRFFIRLQELSFIGWTELISSFISGIFILAGIWLLPKSKLGSYRMFERSILITIYLTQVFRFYQNELGALAGLVYNLLLFIGLRFLINRETQRLHHSG